MTRDPEARRAAILDAAIAVIAERGLGNTSHRAIAARAGVALGSTTYYFPSLAELCTAALERAGDRAREVVRAWASRLAAGADVAEVLTEFVVDYLGDRDQALIEYELYLAAARDPQLRPQARAWVSELQQLLTPRVGDVGARRLSVLVDGVTVQALVLDEPVDAAELAAAVRALIG